MMLNLGCNGAKLQGYVNVDLDASLEPELLDDAAVLSKVEDGQVTEIIASHILEHFPHTRTVEILKVWHRKLAPGGKIKISVPDWDKIVKHYDSHGMLTDWIVNILYGDQNAPFANHYTVFDFSRLSYYLNEAGFRNATVVPDFGGIGRDDFKMPGSGQNVSLNVEAMK